MTKEELQNKVVTLNDEQFDAFKQYAVGTHKFFNDSILHLVERMPSVVTASSLLAINSFWKFAAEEMTDADINKILKELQTKIEGKLGAAGIPNAGFEVNERNWMKYELQFDLINSDQDKENIANLMVDFFRYKQSNPGVKIWDYADYAEFKQEMDTYRVSLEYQDADVGTQPEVSPSEIDREDDSSAKLKQLVNDVNNNVKIKSKNFSVDADTEGWLAAELPFDLINLPEDKKVVLDLIVDYILYKNDGKMDIYDYPDYSEFKAAVEEVRAQAIAAPSVAAPLPTAETTEVFVEGPIDIKPPDGPPEVPAVESKEPTPSETGAIGPAKDIDNLRKRDLVLDQLQDRFNASMSGQKLKELKLIIKDSLNDIPGFGDDFLINEYADILELFIENIGGIKVFANKSSQDLLSDVSLFRKELTEKAKAKVETSKRVDIFEKEVGTKLPAAVSAAKTVEEKAKKKPEEEVSAKKVSITITDELSKTRVVSWDHQFYGEPPVMSDPNLKVKDFSKKSDNPYFDVIRSLPTGNFEVADSDNIYAKRLIRASTENENINALNFHPIFNGMSRNQVLALLVNEPSDSEKGEVYLSSDDIDTIINRVAKQVSDLNNESKLSNQHVARLAEQNPNEALRAAEQSRLNLSRKLDDLLAAIKMRDNEVYSIVDQYIRNKSYNVSQSLTIAAKRSCLISAKITDDEGLVGDISRLAASITRPSMLISSMFEDKTKEQDITQEDFGASPEQIIDTVAQKLKQFLNIQVKERSYWYNYSFCSFAFNTISYSVAGLKSASRKPIDSQYYTSCVVCGKNIYTSRKGSDTYSDYKERLYNPIVDANRIFPKGVILNENVLSSNPFLDANNGSYPPPPGYSGGASWSEIKTMLLSRNKKTYIEGIRRRENVFETLGAKSIFKQPRDVSDSKFRCPFSFEEEQISGVKLESSKSDFKCGNYFDPYEYIKNQGDISVSSIPSTVYGAGDVSTDVSFNAAIESAFESLNISDEKRQELRERLNQEFERRASSGWKYSNKFFNCPCKIDTLTADTQTMASLIKKHPYIAIPLSGPFKKSNTPLSTDYSFVQLREGLNVPYLSPPTNPDGSYSDIEDGTMAYMVCGKEASLSSFNRDPNDPKSLPNLIKTSTIPQLRLLVQELLVLGVDIQDIMEYLVDNDAGAVKVSNLTNGKNERILKMAELLVTAAFPARLDTAATGGGDLKTIDILKDVSLVCKEGHKFKISDSLFFGRTHTSYDMREASSTEVERVINSGILTTQGVSNFDKLLNFTRRDGTQVVTQLDKSRADLYNFENWTLRNYVRSLSEKGQMEAGGVTPVTSLAFSEDGKEFVFGKSKRLYIWGYTGAGREYSGGFTSGRATELVDYEAGGGYVGMYRKEFTTTDEDSGESVTDIDAAMIEESRNQFAEYAERMESGFGSEGVTLSESQLAKSLIEKFQQTKEGPYKATAMLGEAVYKVLEYINVLLKISSSLDIKGMNIGEPSIISFAKPGLAEELNRKFVDIINLVFRELEGPSAVGKIEPSDLTTIKEKVMSNLGFIKLEEKNGEQYLSASGLINDVLNIDLRFASQYDLSLINDKEIAARILNSIAKSALEHISKRDDLQYIRDVILDKYYETSRQGAAYYVLSTSKLSGAISSAITEFVGKIKTEIPSRDEGIVRQITSENINDKIVNLKAKEYLGRVTAASTAYALADYFAMNYARYLKPDMNLPSYIGYDIFGGEAVEDLSTVDGVIAFSNDFEDNKDLIRRAIDPRELWDDMNRNEVFENYISSEDEDLLNALTADQYNSGVFNRFFYGAYGASTNNPSYIIEKVTLNLGMAIPYSASSAMSKKYMDYGVEYIKTVLNEYIQEAERGKGSGKPISAGLAELRGLVNTVLSVNPITTMDISHSGKYRAAFGSESSDVVQMPHELIPLFNARLVKSKNGTYPLFLLTGNNYDDVYHNFRKVFDPSSRPGTYRVLCPSDQRFANLPPDKSSIPEAILIGPSDEYPGWLIYEVKLGKTFTTDFTDLSGDGISLIHHPATFSFVESGRVVGYKNEELNMDTTKSLSITKLASPKGTARLFPPAQIMNEISPAHKEDAVPVVGFTLPIDLGRAEVDLAQQFFAPIVQAKLPVNLDGIEVDMSDFLMRDPPHVAYNILRSIDAAHSAMQNDIQLNPSKKEDIIANYRAIIQNHLEMYKGMPFLVNNKRVATQLDSASVNILMEDKSSSTSVEIFKPRRHPYIPLLDWPTINRMITNDIFGPNYGGHSAWTPDSDNAFKLRVRNAIQQFLIRVNNLDILADILTQKLGIKVDPTDVLNPVDLLKTKGVISPERAKEMFGFDINSVDEYGYISYQGVDTKQESYAKAAGSLDRWSLSPSQFYGVGTSDAQPGAAGDPSAFIRVMNSVFNNPERARLMEKVADPNDKKIISKDSFYTFNYLVGFPTTFRSPYPAEQIPSDPERLEEYHKRRSKALQQVSGKKIQHIALNRNLRSLADYFRDDYLRSLTSILETPQFSPVEERMITTEKRKEVPGKSAEQPVPIEQRRIETPYEFAEYIIDTLIEGGLLELVNEDEDTKTNVTEELFGYIEKILGRGAVGVEQLTNMISKKILESNEVNEVFYGDEELKAIIQGVEYGPALPIKKSSHQSGSILKTASYDKKLLATPGGVAILDEGLAALWQKLTNY
jgi:hypothetical protein